MSVSLAKGGNVSLTKLAPALTVVAVGLGWKARQTAGAEYDLDASALLCGADGKVLSDAHFVFYNQPMSPDGSVASRGDDLVGGEGEGDVETIDVRLDEVPTTVQSIVFPVSIHDADARRQSFGQVRNAYIRVTDDVTQIELARFDLSEDASTETAMVFGELYRNRGEWKFRAIGQGYASGLAGIARDYGVDIG